MAAFARFSAHPDQGDQIEVLRALLEDAADQLDGVSAKIRAKLAELEAEYYPE